MAGAGNCLSPPPPHAASIVLHPASSDLSSRLSTSVNAARHFTSTRTGPRSPRGNGSLTWSTRATMRRESADAKNGTIRCRDWLAGGVVRAYPRCSRGSRCVAVQRGAHVKAPSLAIQGAFGNDLEPTGGYWVRVAPFGAGCALARRAEPLHVQLNPDTLGALRLTGGTVERGRTESHQIP